MSNTTASSEATERFLAALEAPTLAEAVAAYGRAETTFWKRARWEGLTEQIKAKYAHEFVERDAKRIRENREKLAAGRVIQLEMDRQRTADFIEDAEWLALTGEDRDGAVRRLGYESWNALWTRLSNNNRRDIADRITANSGPSAGKLLQGVIGHGRRL